MKMTSSSINNKILSLFVVVVVFFFVLEIIFTKITRRCFFRSDNFLNLSTETFCD
jgi:hypothetical protein